MKHSFHTHTSAYEKLPFKHSVINYCYYFAKLKLNNCFLFIFSNFGKSSCHNFGSWTDDGCYSGKLALALLGILHWNTIALILINFLVFGVSIEFYIDQKLCFPVCDGGVYGRESNFQLYQICRKTTKIKPKIITIRTRHQTPKTILYYTLTSTTKSAAAADPLSGRPSHRQTQRLPSQTIDIKFKNVLLNFINVSGFHKNKAWTQKVACDACDAWKAGWL